MDFVYTREAFRSLADNFEGRRFFVRHGDGDVIISSLMPRTTKDLTMRWSERLAALDPYFR